MIPAAGFFLSHSDRQVNKTTSISILALLLCVTLFEIFNKHVSLPIGYKQGVLGQRWPSGGSGPASDRSSLNSPYTVFVLHWYLRLHCSNKGPYRVILPVLAHYLQIVYIMNCK